MSVLYLKFLSNLLHVSEARKQGTMLFPMLQLLLLLPGCVWRGDICCAMHVVGQMVSAHSFDKSACRGMVLVPLFMGVLEFGWYK